MHNRNTIDEQKSNYGGNARTEVDAGGKFPTLKAATGSFDLPEVSGGQSLSESVDEALKGVSGQAQDKAERIDEGFQVGHEGDLHQKAAAKQP